MTTLQIDRFQLRSWFAAKPGEEVVGFAQDGYRCPVHAAIVELLGVADADVRVGENDVVVQGTTVRVPYWLTHLIYKVDRTRKFREEVTAAQMLALLDTIDTSVLGRGGATWSR